MTKGSKEDGTPYTRSDLCEGGNLSRIIAERNLLAAFLATLVDEEYRRAIDPAEFALAMEVVDCNILDAIMHTWEPKDKSSRSSKFQALGIRDLAEEISSKHGVYCLSNGGA